MVQSAEITRAQTAELTEVFSDLTLPWVTKTRQYLDTIRWDPSQLGLPPVDMKTEKSSPRGNPYNHYPQHYTTTPCVLALSSNRFPIADGNLAEGKKWAERFALGSHILQYLLTRDQTRIERLIDLKEMSQKHCTALNNLTFARTDLRQTMITGIRSVATAVSILTLYPVEGFSTKEELLKAVADQGMVSQLALIMLRGDTASMGGNGHAFSNPVLEVRDGHLRIAQGLLSFLKERRRTGQEPDSTGTNILPVIPGCLAARRSKNHPLEDSSVNSMTSLYVDVVLQMT